MIYLGVLLGLGIMAAMVYLAVDKKSNTATRMASLIALGVMILTIIICLFIVLTDNSVPVDESILIVGAPVEVTDKSGSNAVVLIVLVIFLLAIFAIILIVSMRENRKHNKMLSENSALKDSKPISLW